MSAIDSNDRILASTLLRSQEPPHRPYASSKQFWPVLTWTIRSIFEKRLLTLLKLLSHVAFGVLVGLIYYDFGNDAANVVDNGNLIYYILTFNMVMAMIPAIFTLCADRIAFVREHLGCSLMTYYFARSIIDIVLQTVLTCVFVIIVYFMSSQPREADRMFMFLLINLLTTLVAQSIGLLIGLASNNTELAVYSSAIITMPVLIFSGFFIKLSKIPSYLSWLSYLSYIRYGYEGATISIYGYGRAKLPCYVVYCLFKNPDIYLREMSMENANFWLDFGVLIVFFVVIRVVSCLLVGFRSRRVR